MAVSAGDAALFLGGGLMAGLGRGMVEDGISKRETALKQLEMSHRSAESQKDRDALADRSRLEREHQSGLKDREIAAADKREEATRLHNRGLLSNRKFITGTDGTVAMVNPDGTAKKVYDEEGNPITERATGYAARYGDKTLVRIGTKTGQLYAGDVEKGENGEEIIELPTAEATKIAIATGNNRTKEYIAGLTSDTKVTVADKNNATKVVVQDKKNTGAENVQMLRNEGSADTQRLRNEGASDVQDLRNQGSESTQMLRNEGSVDTQNMRNRGLLATQDSRNEGNLAVQGSRNEGAQSVAETRAAASRDNAQTAASSRVAAAKARNAGADADADMMQRREARAQAVKEAEDKASVWNSDKTDFGANGRERWIEDRTDEILAKRRGLTPQAEPEDGEPKDIAPSDRKTLVQPATGKGTKAEPYKPLTQAEVDWFKEKAPKGAIMQVEVGGQTKLYVK